MDVKTFFLGALSTCLLFVVLGAGQQGSPEWKPLQVVGEVKHSESLANSEILRGFPHEVNILYWRMNPEATSAADEIQYEIVTETIYAF